MISCPHCSGTGRVLDSAAIGAAARKRREAAGLTQGEVAAGMGYSTSYISQLERGLKHWTPELIAANEAAILGARNNG